MPAIPHSNPTHTLAASITKQGYGNTVTFRKRRPLRSTTLCWLSHRGRPQPIAIRRPSSSTLRSRHCQVAHRAIITCRPQKRIRRHRGPSRPRRCAGFSGHTNATRLADLNNLEILSRGTPVQQDVVNLTIHHRITQ